MAHAPNIAVQTDVPVAMNGKGVAYAAHERNGTPAAQEQHAVNGELAGVPIEIRHVVSRILDTVYAHVRLADGGAIERDDRGNFVLKSDTGVRHLLTADDVRAALRDGEQHPALSDVVRVAKAELEHLISHTYGLYAVPLADGRRAVYKPRFQIGASTLDIEETDMTEAKDSADVR